MAIPHHAPAPGFSDPSVAGGEHGVRYRIGAVAHMLGMPVATLRVWEGRYRLAQTPRSAGGHRLYGQSDVQRLTLIKQLTDRGQAIGTLAALDLPQLLAAKATHDGSQRDFATATEDVSRVRNAPLQVALVGAVLEFRFTKAAFSRQCGRMVSVLGPYESLAEAARRLGDVRPDAVVLHMPGLHAGWLPQMRNSVPTLFRSPVCVMYGFASQAACRELAQAGIMAVPGAHADAVLASWLGGLAGSKPAQAQFAPMGADDTVPARRWSDSAIASFAALPATVTCECPRHVADILTQLLQFEIYSAECEDRSDKDVELHRYLRTVTARARAMFEDALERVATTEALPLPGVVER
jgi:MerR family transcriptional regulator, light-induced transcriptional regulator